MKFKKKYFIYAYPNMLGYSVPLQSGECVVQAQPEPQV